MGGGGSMAVWKNFDNWSVLAWVHGYAFLCVLLNIFSPEGGNGQSNIVIKHKLFNTCLWILHAIASPGKPMGKAENVKFQVCGECGSLDGSTLAPLTGEWHESYFRGWTPRVQSPQLNYLARISKAEGGTFFTQEGLPCGSEILQSTQSTDRNIMQCETCQPVIHCHIWKGARSEFRIRWKDLRSNRLKLKCYKHQGLHGWNAR